MQGNCLEAIAHSLNQLNQPKESSCEETLLWDSKPDGSVLGRALGESSRSVVSPLVQLPPLLQCEVCVIVPVRDEAEHIEATLVALAEQVDLQGQRLDPSVYEVILLVNNCTDSSATIARQFAVQHPRFVLHVVERTLPPEEAYVGRVRQLLMDEAYRRLNSLGRTRGIIASTDGDSRVDSVWIATIIHEISRGADAVGGRIVTDAVSRAALDTYSKAFYLRSVGYHYLMTELECYLDPDPFDCFPRHHQFFGANFAVTAEFYALAGGMPAVRTPEDVAFRHALIVAGARFRHSPLVRVTTSARQTGRTPVGLANQLTQWQAMGQQKQPFLVESLAALEARFQARHQLRTLWWQLLADHRLLISEISVLADQLAVSSKWLRQELSQMQPLGLLFRRIEQRQQEEVVWQERWPLVRIEEAIADLRLRLYQLRANRSSRYSCSRRPCK